jgi:hypothetical protein
MQFVQPMPFTEAVEKIGARAPIGSQMMSAEWQDVPVALRERAFFSSQVENARFLQRARDKITDFMTGARETLPDGQTMLKTGSRAAFVEQMRAFALSEGMGPIEEGMAGGLRDITSEKRLGLIFNVQNQQADDYGYWRQGMDPDVLNEFPAQRFVRVQEVKVERESHIPHENQVYLKTDPIWATVINKDFGVPWGPWGWGCGHDVEDVDRDEAESLALVKPGGEIAPDRKNFNENVQASAATLDPDLRDKLLAEFGNQIEWDGNSQVLRWNPAEIERRLQEEAPPVRESPVSDAIEVMVKGKAGELVDAAMAAIDRVHDDGELPDVELRASTRSSFGYFQPRLAAQGIEADHIGVRESGSWPALTAVHETGHFLDLEAIGAKGNYATLQGHREMANVLAAANRTEAVTALNAKLAGATNEDAKDELRYLLKPEEIWARAYAQYVTQESGSWALRRDLAKLMADEHYKQRQWAETDFAPVSAAIGELFNKLGWL